VSAILKLSEQFLSNIKHGNSYQNEIIELSQIRYENLLMELETDNHKKTFWLNIYNSFYQIYAKTILDKSIYTQKVIIIADMFFSLDTIEHGILRKGKFVIGFGYLKNPFYASYIKQLQVNNIDYRIHFALNCGAISCPPIFVYEFEQLDKQLNSATDSFIEAETTINADSKTISTSKLFLWYKGDFGSNKNIKILIGKIFNLQINDYLLKYTDYNWTKKLDNYS
jgi:hypothetical protein